MSPLRRRPALLLLKKNRLHACLIHAGMAFFSFSLSFSRRVIPGRQSSLSSAPNVLPAVTIGTSRDSVWRSKEREREKKHTDQVHGLAC